MEGSAKRDMAWSGLGARKMVEERVRGERSARKICIRHNIYCAANWSGIPGGLKMALVDGYQRLAGGKPIWAQFAETDPTLKNGTDSQLLTPNGPSCSSALPGRFCLGAVSSQTNGNGRWIRMGETGRTECDGTSHPLCGVCIVRLADTKGRRRGRRCPRRDRGSRFSRWWWL